MSAAPPGLPSFFRLAPHERLPSTNDEAKALAAAGAPAGTLVWARRQSAGRGRYGRSWVSLPGNLFASLILRPEVRAAAAAQLGFAAALAAREASLGFAPDAAIAFKWPNDVLLQSRKLAGILLESEASSSGNLAWLVIGIGVNLASYPTDTPYPATALGVTGADVAPAAMLAAWARHFLRRYEEWDGGRGFAAQRVAWLGHAAGLGQGIRVRLAREELAGIFAGLDADGALLLDAPSGRRRIEAGEVFPAALVQ